MKSGDHTKFKTFNFDKRHGQRYTMPLCHFDTHNLWILKPTHLNCGRGIHVFRDLESLHKLIKQYCVGKETTKKAPTLVKLVEEAAGPTNEEEKPAEGAASPTPGLASKKSY